jgi:hypothetical protein
LEDQRHQNFYAAIALRLFVSKFPLKKTKNLTNFLGVDLTVTQSNGSNILHQACAGGSLDVVKYIVNLGFDVRTKI